jgi:hypothetical protein
LFSVFSFILWQQRLHYERNEDGYSKACHSVAQQFSTPHRFFVSRLHIAAADPL